MLDFIRSHPVGGLILCSELEMMNGVLSTIGNGNGKKNPLLVNFDPITLPVLVSQNLANYPQYFLFAFVMDSLSGSYTAAVYKVGEEGDTNAIAMQLEPNFSPFNVKRIGVLGVEKFRDIGTIGDGYIASVVRNNKGLGGYDNYISHLTMALDTIMEETDGKYLITYHTLEI